VGVAGATSQGLSPVNMLPGATVPQLGIFPGYAGGGWWGASLGGACFVLPGFVVMLVLTLAYAALAPASSCWRFCPCSTASGPARGPGSSRHTPPSDPAVTHS
jgi:hypothetical protein